jgi:F0F1-type ATP synthase membrane subunit b/b'
MLKAIIVFAVASALSLALRAAGLSDLVPGAFNLTLLVGLLFFKTRDPLRQFVRVRHETIREELQRTAIDLRTAKQRFEEFSARLASMQSEAAALREQAKQDAQVTKTRIVDDAKRLASTIVTDARSSGEGLYNDFRRQLREEFAEKVISRAEALLTARLTGEDQARLREDFTRQLGGVQ